MGLSRLGVPFWRPPVFFPFICQYLKVWCEVKGLFSRCVFNFECFDDMLGSLIGGALKIGGTIFGGIKASQAMRRVKSDLEAQRRENETWFNRRVNEDATQRADAQRILSITQENIRQRNRQAAGAQAVAGGTEESVAAAKAANNEALSEAASQIAVAGERRKDAVEQEYRQRDGQLRGQLNNLEMGRANNIAQAVGGVGSAAAGLAEVIPDPKAWTKKPAAGSGDEIYG